MNQAIGRKAEKIAFEYLHGQGFTLIEQNYRCKFGEIDLIMRDKNDIIFIEVRSRSRIDYGNASESINKRKQDKVVKSAMHYLQTKSCFNKVCSRFDVIAIHFVNGETKIEWIKDAFSAEF